MVLIVCKDQTNGFQSFRMRSFLEIIGKSLWCLKGKLFMGLKVLNLIVQRIPSCLRPAKAGLRAGRSKAFSPACLVPLVDFLLIFQLRHRFLGHGTILLYDLWGSAVKSF